MARVIIYRPFRPVLITFADLDFKAFSIGVFPATTPTGGANI